VKQNWVHNSQSTRVRPWGRALCFCLATFPLWTPVIGMQGLGNGTAVYAQFSPFGNNSERGRSTRQDQDPSQDTYDSRGNLGNTKKDPFAPTDTLSQDTTQVVAEDLKAIHREHNHKEQVITAGAFMATVVFLLAAMNNFNPRQSK
jgi:hypothetical protein